MKIDQSINTSVIPPIESTDFGVNTLKLSTRDQKMNTSHEIEAEKI